MVLISLLFGVVGFYLTLIAKFYRQKFSKGPPHHYFQMALGVLIIGLILNLKLGASPLVPEYVAQGVVCAGGIAFSGFCYALYRTMMSVD